jgi:thioredoxin-like negative regulator of GroEL
MTGRSGGSGGNRRNLLVFFSAWRSGPARRMDSLLAQLARKERHRLEVTRVDVEEQPELAKRFNVRRVPTLVLVQGKRAVARLEGRANAAEIEQLVEPHLEGSKSGGGPTSVGPNDNRREEEHA